MILTEEQKSVISFDGKHALVVAAAGCGKTTTLVEYVMRRLNLDGSKQIVLTFSNKAAADAKEKIAKTIPGYSESIFVGTIHEFASRIVNQYGRAIGLESRMQVFENDADRLDIVADAVSSIPSLRSKLVSVSEEGRNMFLRNVMSQIDMCKRQMIEPENDIGRIMRNYRDMLQSMNAMDFDDLVIYAIRILTETPSVANIYRTYYSGISIDEAQDLNHSQYCLVKAIAGDSMNILMIGDPNQAIYGFSGASPEYMCRLFPDDYLDCEKFRLTENFRSSKMVLKAAHAINSDFDPQGKVPIEGDFGVLRFDDPGAEAEYVISRIQNLLEHGHPDIEGLRREGICVIARTRSGLKHIIDRCHDVGLEYTIKQTIRGTPFVSEFFEALFLGMRLTVNPKDDYHRRRFNSIIGLDTEVPFEPSSWVGTSPMIESLAAILSEMGAQERMGDFSPEKYRDIIERYIASREDEEVFELSDDLDEWDSMIHGYLLDSQIGNRNITGLLAAASLGKTRNSTEHGIILSTAHMTKGLEYDVVFIIGVNDGVFPDFRAETEEERLEERHSFFVALTRARRLCYVSYVDRRPTRFGTRTVRPSDYIGDLVDGGLPFIDLS